MKNVGHPKNFGSFEHRPREQRKTLGVVGIVSGGSSIERFAVELRRVVNKIKAYARVTASGDPRAEEVVVIKRHSYAADNRLGIGEFSLAIPRQIYTHLVAGSHQGSRQSAHDVG
jgi:hypothetical protein